MFNKYFSTIGQELTKHFTNADTASSVNKIPSCNKSFKFRLIPVTFNLKKLSSLRETILGPVLFNDLPSQISHETVTIICRRHFIRLLHTSPC